MTALPPKAVIRPRSAQWLLLTQSGHSSLTIPLSAITGFQRLVHKACRCPRRSEGPLNGLEEDNCWNTWSNPDPNHRGSPQPILIDGMPAMQLFQTRWQNESVSPLGRQSSLHQQPLFDAYPVDASHHSDALGA